MFETLTYQKRRKALRERMSNGLILILGNNEAPANYPDNTYKFRQDSSFLYFFGHSHPGYAGVIDIDNNEEYFFGDDVDMDDIIWMGPQPSIKELAERVGVSKSFPFEKLKDVIGKALSQRRKVHFLPPYRYDNMMLLEDLTGIKASMVKTHASVELIKAVVSLRAVNRQGMQHRIRDAYHSYASLQTGSIRTIHSRHTGRYSCVIRQYDIIRYYPYSKRTNLA